jgi:hypothetical protein
MTYGEMEHQLSGFLVLKPSAYTRMNRQHSVKMTSMLEACDAAPIRDYANLTVTEGVKTVL